MLVIRFNRVGKKNKAHFRIVVQEHTIAPGGRHVEILGSYDPHLKKGVFKNERIKYWIDKGAQISDSVYNLFIKQEIVTGKKRPVKISKKKKKGEEEKVEKPSSASAATEAKADKKVAEDKKPARNATQSVVGGEEVKAEAPEKSAENKEAKEPVVGKKEEKKEVKPSAGEAKKEDKKPAHNAGNNVAGGKAAKEDNPKG